MSGANKKQAAAQKARLEREAAEKASAERAKRLKLLGGALVSVLVIVGIVLAVAGGGDDGTDGKDGSAETTKLIGQLPTNGTLLGDPNAPVTIHEFADLKCPACKQWEIDSQQENVDTLVRTGKANLRLHLVNIIDPNVGTEDGAAGRRAANNLVEKNKFWPFVSTLYYNQGLESDSWIDEGKLEEIAGIAPGVEPADISVTDTAKTRQLANDADKLFQDLKADSTPSFFVQARGTREYKSVESSVASISAAVEEATKKAQPAAAAKTTTTPAATTTTAP